MPQLVDPWGPSIRSLRDLGDTMDTMYERRKADEATAYERDRTRTLDQSHLATLGLQQERMRFNMDEDRQKAQQIQSLRDLQGEISQGVPQAGPTLSGAPLPNRPYSDREKAERYQEFVNKFMLDDPTKFSDITDKFNEAEQKKHKRVLDAVQAGGLEYGKQIAAEVGINPALLDSMSLTPEDVAFMEIPGTGHTLIRTPDGKYLIDKPDVKKGAGGGGSAAPEKEKRGEGEEKPDPVVVREAVRDLPKMRREALTAEGQRERLKTMLPLVRDGVAGGLQGKVLSLVSSVLDIPATSEAALFDQMAKVGAGQLRATVIGPGQVSNYENQLLQEISGGGLKARSAVIALFEFYDKEAQRLIDNYNNARDDASEVAPSAAKAFRRVGKEYKVGQKYNGIAVKRTGRNADTGRQVLLLDDGTQVEVE